MGIFYKDKPVFGLDIGRSSIKVMQIDQTGKKTRVVGYGTIGFDTKAINKDGVVIEPEILIKAIHDLIEKQIIGSLTTRRVAVSVPNENSFSRVLTLPKMEKKDLESAIAAEVDQSIPLATDKLYYDFAVTRILDDGMQEIQVIASPRAIIDSYMGVFQALGLEIALIESNITSTTRMVVHAEVQDTNTLIVDVGSSACDISIYDGLAIRATGTVDCSSERLTENIAKSIGISLQQAHSIKTRYGLGVSKKQEQILDAIEPELSKLISEIKKVMRYFSDRSTSNASPIGQIIILGGGANLPGLAGYITNKTRVATRLCSPWNNLTFGKLQPPHELETTMYTTAGGLALVTPQELKK